MGDDFAIAEAEARVGTLLQGRWRLDRLLALGGMAAIYAATHRNRRRVAIKMLRPEFSRDPNVHRRFLREGYIANMVGHPGVVAIDDDDVAEDGSAFIVMELLEGEPLDRLARQRAGRLPGALVVWIADQMLEALAAAHARNIVHRDIKPANVFLTLSGQVKILDFGIAQLRQATRVEPAMTCDGIIMGTPAFMAPEQARARWELVDHQTDLWAVGATMFTLLSGRFVHEAKTLNEQLARAVFTPAPPLGSVLTGAPKSLRKVVDRALAYEKGDRWCHARAMQNMLRQASADLGGPAPLLGRQALADRRDARASGRRPRSSGSILFRTVLVGASAAVAQLIVGPGATSGRAHLEVGRATNAPPAAPAASASAVAAASAAWVDEEVSVASRLALAAPAERASGTKPRPPSAGAISRERKRLSKGTGIRTRRGPASILVKAPLHRARSEKECTSPPKSSWSKLRLRVAGAADHGPVRSRG